MFPWLSRNLFLLPEYNKAPESVFLTKDCALKNVTASFLLQNIYPDKFSSAISGQGIEKFECLHSIRPTKALKLPLVISSQFSSYGLYNSRLETKASETKAF